MKSFSSISKSALPRERLRHSGAQNLSEIELIAIILGTGSKEEHVLDRSKKLLMQYSLPKLAETTQEELYNTTTLGLVQAGRMIAAIELGRRIFVKPIQKRILSAQDIFNETHDIHTKHQEYLLCLYLNARHELMEKKIVAVGSINQAIIEARDIFVSAIRLPANYIVLVHNHPSGDPTPSSSDITLTDRIQQAGYLLGVILVDHVIVTSQSYFSFRQLHLMKSSKE